MTYVYKININNLRERLFTSARKAVLFMINHADIYNIKLLRINRIPSTALTVLRRGLTFKAIGLPPPWKYPNHVGDLEDFFYLITKEEVH